MNRCQNGGIRNVVEKAERDYVTLYFLVEANMKTPICELKSEEVTCQIEELKKIFQCSYELCEGIDDSISGYQVKEKLKKIEQRFFDMVVNYKYWVNIVRKFKELEKNFNECYNEIQKLKISKSNDVKTYKMTEFFCNYQKITEILSSMESLVCEQEKWGGVSLESYYEILKPLKAEKLRIDFIARRVETYSEHSPK